MKLSIITATYNSEHTIKACMLSIINQSYKDIEHIIIDGNSTDRTLEVLVTITEKYPEANIRIYSEPDTGIYDALNKGIEKANGDVIGFVHSDDLLASPKILEHIVNIFKSQNSDGVYGNLRYVKKNNTNKVIRNWKSKAFTPAILNRGWMPPHPTVFLRKEVYQDIGYFDINYKISADYDFLIRVFLNKKYKIRYIPKTIMIMRLGGMSNKSFKNIFQKSKEDFQVIKRHQLRGLFTLICKNILKLNQFFIR